MPLRGLPPPFSSSFFESKYANFATLKTRHLGAGIATIHSPWVGHPHPEACQSRASVVECQQGKWAEPELAQQETDGRFPSCLLAGRPEPGPFRRLFPAGHLSTKPIRGSFKEGIFNYCHRGWAGQLPRSLSHFPFKRPEVFCRTSLNSHLWPWKERGLGHVGERAELLSRLSRSPLSVEKGEGATVLSNTQPRMLVKTSIETLPCVASPGSC